MWWQGKSSAELLLIRAGQRIETELGEQSAGRHTELCEDHEEPVELGTSQAVAGPLLLPLYLMTGEAHDEAQGLSGRE